jgi:hypothetical protein
MTDEPKQTAVEKKIEAVVEHVVDQKIEEKQAAVEQKAEEKKTAGTIHAVTNPSQWVNMLTLVAGIVTVFATSDFVKHNYPEILGGLILANTLLTTVLQFIRDKNKPPAGIENAAK